MNRSRGYSAFYIPTAVEPDRAIALGIDWLLEQPGEPVILLHAKKMIDNNRVLARMTHQYRIRHEAPQTIWKSRHWSGGAILAPWASADVIRSIDDDLAHLG